MPRLSVGKLGWRFLAPIARSVLFCSERRPSYRVACCGCLSTGRLLFRGRERSEQSPPGTGPPTHAGESVPGGSRSSPTQFVGRSLSLRTALRPIAGNSGACQHWELTAEVSHQTPPVALPTPQHPPRSRRTNNSHQDYGWQNRSRQNCYRHKRHSRGRSLHRRGKPPAFSLKQRNAALTRDTWTMTPTPG